MVALFAGLGLAAKLAAATGVLALGITGVGAAGALPGPAQNAFDGVVSTIVPTDDEGVDDGAVDECTVDDGVVDDGAEACAEVLPVGSKEFSDWVVRGAQDPNKVGSEFGRAVSEQARELRTEKAEERAEKAEERAEKAEERAEKAEERAENAELRTEKAEELAENGGNNGNNGNGKRADKPGGRP